MWGAQVAPSSAQQWPFRPRVDVRDQYGTSIHQCSRMLRKMLVVGIPSQEFLASCSKAGLDISKNRTLSMPNGRKYIVF
eukprot:2121906-Rhodomonas_salina.4